MYTNRVDRKAILLINADMSTQSLLTEVEDAIRATLLSQEYTIRGRRQMRARLKDLFSARKELREELANETSNGGSMLRLTQYIPPR